MKKILLAVLTLMMAFTLSSCSNKQAKYGPKIEKDEALQMLDTISERVNSSAYSLPEKYTMTQTGLAALIVIIPAFYEEYDVYDPTIEYMRREAGKTTCWVFRNEAGELISAKKETVEENEEEVVKKTYKNLGVSGNFDSAVNDSKIYLLSQSLKTRFEQIKTRPLEIKAQIERFGDTGEYQDENTTYRLTSFESRSSGDGCLYIEMTVKSKNTDDKNWSKHVYTYFFEFYELREDFNKSPLHKDGNEYHWDQEDVSYPDLSEFTLDSDS